MTAKNAQQTANGVGREVAPLVIAKNAQRLANEVALKVEPLVKPPGKSASETYVVQLATYQATNCDKAQTEINSYHDIFSIRPTLWRASKNFVVVVIKAATQDEAKSLQHEALELAQDSALSGNNLGNASVQTNRGWTPLPNCSAR